MPDGQRGHHPGTSLADSNALGNALERLMLSVPVSPLQRVGPDEPSWKNVQGVESAEIDVRLEMKDRSPEASSRSSGKGVAAPGHERHHWPADLHRIDHMLSGTRANIAVKIFGDDLPTLRQLASQVQSEMSQVAESSTSRPSSKPTSRP